MAMISETGKAQVYNQQMDSFTLQKMKVERIVVSGASWIGFLGYRTTEEDDSAEKSVESKTEQTFEIFSQKNLGFCLHTIKAERGGLITDAVAHSLEVFTLGY